MKTSRILAAGIASLLLIAPSAVAQLSWDTNTGTGGAQGGTGNWTGNSFWNTGASNVAWTNGSSAIFGGTAGTVTVNSAAVTANALTFNVSNYIISGASVLTLGGATPTITVTTSGQTATISAVLGGSAGFTKSGAGALTLSGASANTFTGAAIIADGTVTLNKTAGVAAITSNLFIGDGIGAAGSANVTQQASDQIADAATVTIAGDGLWNLGVFNRSETIAALVMQVGSSVATGLGTLTVAGNISATGSSILSTPSISGLLNLAGATRTFDIEDGVIFSDMDISAVISNGGMTKTGAGRLTLSGANTFANAVTINAGVVSVSDVADSGANSHLGAGGSIVFGGGTLAFTGASDSTNRAVTLNAGGGTIDVGSGASVLTFSGAIGGVSGFAKTGAGTLSLDGVATNTYAGTVSVAAGTLNLNKSVGLTAITGDLVIGDDVGAAGSAIVTLGANEQIANSSNVTINSDGAWNLASGNRSETIASLTLAGCSVATGTGTLTVAGNLTTNASAATATVSGLLSLGGATRTFDIADGAAASDLTISAVISNGGIIKTGAGTMTLSGVNTFTSSVNFNGGTISVADVTNVGVNSPFGTTNLLAFDGGTLSFTGGSDSTNRRVFPSPGGCTIEVTNAAAVLTMGGGFGFGGTGGVTKTGAGTLAFDAITFGQPNNYTGPTTINGGTLRLSGGSSLSDSTATTLANTTGVVLDLDGTNETIGSLAGGGANGGNITLGVGTLTTNGDNTSTSYDGVISGTGGLVKLGSGTLTLTRASSFTGGVTIGGGTLTAVSIANSGTNSALGADGTINYAAFGILSYSGPTASTNRTFTIGSTFGELALPFAATTLTISGNIGGSGAFSKAGPGALVLSGVNSYSGTTFVSGGTLRVSGGNAIPDTSDVTLSNIAGGVFDLNGSNETIRSLFGGGAIGGNVTLGGGTLTLNSASGTNYQGSISGSGGLTKTGIGTFALQGANSFGGPLTINAGTISAQAFGAIPSNAAVVIGNVSGATLDVSLSAQSIGSLAGGGPAGGRVSLGNSTLTVGNDNTSTTYSGTIDGSNGSLTKVGTGTLTLAASNSFSGTTTINGGVLRATNANALSNSFTVSLADVAGAALDFAAFNGSLRSLSGGGPSGGNLILSGGAASMLTVGNANISTTYAGAISGSGGLNKVGVGTLTLSGTNTFGGELFISDGKLRLTGGAAAGDTVAVTMTNIAEVLEVSGGNETIGSLAATVGTVALNGGSLITGGNNDSTSVSVIISGTGGLTKAGTGTFTISGANTYSGPTTINAGTLRLGGGAAIADDSPVTLANTAGAILDLNGVSETIASLAGGGALGGSVILGGATLTVGADGLSTTFAGSISGAGGLVKIGTGGLTLAGASTFSGTTQIDGGILRLGVAAALPSDTAMTIGSSGGATFDLNGIATTIGSLNGNGGVALGGGVLTTGGNGTSTTYGGIISGAGGLTKTGFGTFTLNGTNIYTGTTTLSAGTLRLGIAGALRDTTPVFLFGDIGSALDLNGNNQTIGSLSGGSGLGGNVILGNGTLTVGSDNSTTSYDGVISGNGGLTKIGFGTLTLTRDSTFLGPAAIQAGTISVSNVANIGAGSTILLGGSTTAGTLAFVGASNSTNRSIQLATGGGIVDVGPSTLTLFGAITGAGGLTKAGVGTLQLSSAANTYSGATTVSRGTLLALGGSAIGDSSAVILANVAGVVFIINANETIGSLAGGGAAGGNVLLGISTLTTGGDNTSTTFAGAISGAGGKLTKTGTGTLTLSGANTFSSTTTINGGVLRLTGGSALADSSVVDLADTTGAALDLAGSSETIGALTGGGANGGNVWLGAGTLTVAASLTSNYTGAISGTGGLTISGLAHLTLTGSNSYTGPTSIGSVGVLTLDNGLGTPGAGIVVSGLLEGRNVINRAIAGAGTIIATGSLLIGDPTSTSGFNHSGALTVGTNLVVLLDANAADLGTSTTLDVGGRLDALNGISLAAGRSLTAAASTTITSNFINNGTVNGPGGAGQFLTFTDDVSGAGSYTGNILFTDGFSPGNSPALVTFGGDVVYGTFATVQMELGGTTRGTQYDALNVAGKLTFGGTLNVPLINAFVPQFGHVFNLFDFGTTAGTFGNVNLPALNPGLAWTQANLYTAGEIQVTLDTAFTSRTWDGGGANNDWATDNNWTLDVEPLNNGTAALVFAGNVRLTPSVDAAWNVASITFDPTAGAFTITGPQGVTVGAGGIVNNDSQTQTIIAAVTLSASESFTAAAGDLAFANVDIGAQTLTIAGANDVTLDDVSGTGAITKTGAGTLDLVGAVGTGAITFNANAGATQIAGSQTLAGLNIGAGAAVSLITSPPLTAAAAVPEPGGLTLLLWGGALLGLRRRAQ